MVLDWGLNPGPSALEASTIPLGYQGGGDGCYERTSCEKHECVHFAEIIHTPFEPVYIY